MKIFLSILLLLFTLLGVAQSPELEELRTMFNSLGIMDDPQELIAKATEYIEKDGTSSEAYQIRGRAHLRVDYEKGIADLKKSVQLDSTNVGSYTVLGNYLFGHKNYPESIFYYELSIKHGGHIDLLVNIAVAYEKMLDHEGWETAAKRVIESDVDADMKQLGYASLGRLYESKGDDQKMLDNYIKACEIGDSDQGYLCIVARLLIKLNRKEEACAYLERAKLADDYGYCDDLSDLIDTNCSK